MGSVIGYVERTEDGPSVLHNEPVKKLNRMFVSHLQRVYGENGSVFLWKCGFEESETTIWVYHHEYAAGPYEALLVDSRVDLEEYIVVITTLVGEMLLFRCLSKEDVESKIEAYFGQKTLSRRLGDRLVLRARGIFVPNTVPQALVFRI